MRRRRLPAVEDVPKRRPVLVLVLVLVPVGASLARTDRQKIAPLIRRHRTTCEAEYGDEDEDDHEDEDGAPLLFGTPLCAIRDILAVAI